MLFALGFLLVSSAALLAQEQGVVVDTKKHKIVFQLTTSDTVSQKHLMANVHHLLVALPKSRIEVVCHGNGITLLTAAQTKEAKNIEDLTQQGVDFVACENTMRIRKIKREELIKTCRTVPSGVAEVVLKEEKGWTYIKSGL